VDECSYKKILFSILLGVPLMASHVLSLFGSGHTLQQSARTFALFQRQPFRFPLLSLTQLSDNESPYLGIKDIFSDSWHNDARMRERAVCLARNGKCVGWRVAKARPDPDARRSARLLSGEGHAHNMSFILHTSTLLTHWYPAP
jgi:hypothetical protein